MISAIQWIRKGVAAEQPEKYKLDESELERISKLAADRLGEAKVDLANAQKGGEMDIDSDDSETEDAVHEKDNDMREYDLEQEEMAEAEAEPGRFMNRKDLAYYQNEEDDPYITLKNEDDEAEEMEEMRILPTDNMMLAVKTEDDVSQMEVYVYEREENNLYVHHDVMLPSFPLCLEWLDFHTGDKAGQEGSGNYVAIGTFEPDIEIWNVDLVDAMLPQTILGSSNPATAGAKPKKKKSKKANSNYHVDAVMDLSWNKQHRNFLLSSSADTTVKLWDLNNSTCVQSYNHHSDKVQAVAWNPVEATAFVSGGYDKSICVLDARSPNNVTRWTIESDVESIVWDPHNPTNFYLAMENGMVQYYDVRVVANGAGGKAIFTLQAHDGAVSALDVNPVVPNCIATGSTDKLVKVWNTTDNRPSMVASRNFELGHVFSAKFCPDEAMELAISGSEGKIHIWDMKSNAGVRQAYNISA
ncbi:hypothetical protein LRAMOSA02091 [Lichtheimia ramosa]|uniref:Uncharacterized protein n=1 Tax=Lichtheimia ramosa TaxID=688394 RepID=A0A077WLV5_9FUNG|nr:hypothetical protein LRAMOSA02091 [Lichtheimia ramosa]